MRARPALLLALLVTVGLLGTACHPKARSSATPTTGRAKSATSTTKPSLHALQATAKEELPQPPAPPPAVADGPVHEFEAPADCSRDVTDDLNRFIAGVPDGSTLGFGTAACYRVDGTVRVENRHNLVFEGRGARFEATPGGTRKGKHWVFLRGGGFVIRNLTIKGAQDPKTPNKYVSAREGETGLLFGGVDGAMVQHLTVTNVFGDFVYFGDNPDDHSQWTSRVAVTDSTFDRSGRQGMTFEAAKDITVEGNTMKTIGRSAFDIEPNSGKGGAERVRIAANTVSTWTNALLPVAGRGAVRDVAVEDNVLHGRAIFVFVRNLSRMSESSRRNRISVIGNRSDKPAKISVVNVQDTDGLVVRGNVQQFDSAKRKPAVKVFRTCAVAVAGNQFDGAADQVVSDNYRCPA